ncbi:MAG: SpoIIE family protein phosphatase [Rhodothermales bacterium]|nr:SpoIIE family protein phosphatase [Rhodothermales bacterium]
MQDTPSHVQRAKRYDLRALFEASRLLSGSLDLSFVLNNLLLTAMSKLLVTRGIGLLDGKQPGVYRAVIVKGLWDIPVESTIAVDMAAIKHILRDDEVPETLRRHQVVLLLPIISSDKLIGLVGLGKKATGVPFSDEELEFIQSLVNMSAAAVKNSLVVEELRQTNRTLDGKIQQLNTLFDLSQQFNATFDRSQLLKMLTFTLMGQMLINKYLFIMRRPGGAPDTPNGLHVIASHNVPDCFFPEATMDALDALQTDCLLSTETPAELAPISACGMTLILPIRHQDETSAVLCLGPKMTGKPFVDDDLELLSAFGNLAYVSLQNTYLVEEQIEKERLEEELRLARDIQLGLLPQEIPELAGIEIAAMAFPSRHVGGDYYDLVSQSNGSLLMAIADVTGKGLPASLLMANLQACLHTLTPMELTLEEVAGHMNRVICQNTAFDKFITAFLAVYTPGERRVDYVNAGHNPPMLLRASGDVELLEKGGLLLGVIKGIPYERGTLFLGSGDVLALFTDGVTEAMGPNEDEYGEERLIQLLRDLHQQSAQDILDAVRSDIISFTGSATLLSDDLTMIVVKGS